MKFTVTVVKVAASGTVVAAYETEISPDRAAQYVRDRTEAINEASPGCSVSVVANPAAR